MQPESPSLSDAMRIIDGLKIPAGAEFDWRKAHRMALATEADRGLVSTMVANGLFYANAVGAFGFVSAWRN